MPLYETSCQVSLPYVEAIPFDVGTAYPYPRLELRHAGLQSTSVRVIVIENDWLKIGILPDLGGRIMIPFGETLDLGIEEGGRRGARMHGGIEFSLDGRERLNAMGPVEVRRLDEDEDEAILIGEFSAGEGVSWSMRVGIAKDRAAVQVDAKVFNRERLPCPYRGGFLVPDGMYVGAEPGILVEGFRHQEISELAPRQTDSWSCEIVPTSLTGKLHGSPSLLAGWDGSSLHIQPLLDMPRHKVVLLSEGETIETVADFKRNQVARFELTDVPVEAVAIIGPTGPVFEWDLASEDPPSYADGVLKDDPAAYRRELTRADSRGAAYVGLAMQACRKGDWEAAIPLLDEALGVNAEDPLTWWLKAAVMRHQGVSNESELLNSHYLAPFEPMLRAESYLASPGETKAPSTLLAPMMEDPDAVVEVAVQLHDAGLREDLSKWADECFRHREIPMIRYLLADALLTNSRMRAEAASHVMAVAKAPINPPYPWRRVEREVLARLRRAFPNDQRIEELSKGL